MMVVALNKLWGGTRHSIIKVGCLMFNNTKLERAEKRTAESAQQVECQTKLRRTSLEGQMCFICDKKPHPPGSQDKLWQWVLIREWMNVPKFKMKGNILHDSAVEMLLHRGSNTMLHAWQTCTIERGHTSEPSRDCNREMHLKRMPTHRHSQS